MPLEFLGRIALHALTGLVQLAQRVDAASMASWGVEQRPGACAGALAWHSTHA